MVSGVYTTRFSPPRGILARIASVTVLGAELDMIGCPVACEGGKRSMAKQRKTNRVAIRLNETQLELIEGDITELDVDAIVNPANEDLKLGSGVAGAIREKGGASIQKECKRIGGTPVGTAVITGAGELPHKHVIHAVGPRMGDGDEDRKLAAAVRSSLALADRHGLKSVAVPAISTGNFDFPVNRCARVTLTEIHRYMQGGTKLERVVVCLFDKETFSTFRQELRRGFR